MTPRDFCVVHMPDGAMRAMRIEDVPAVVGSYRPNPKAIYPCMIADGSPKWKRARAKVRKLVREEYDRAALAKQFGAANWRPPAKMTAAEKRMAQSIVERMRDNPLRDQPT